MTIGVLVVYDYESTDRIPPTKNQNGYDIVRRKTFVLWCPIISVLQLIITYWLKVTLLTMNIFVYFLKIIIQFM